MLIKLYLIFFLKRNKEELSVKKLTYLKEIEEGGKELAQSLPSHTAHGPVSIWPRKWWKFLGLGHKQLRVWRLGYLDQPLWLGEDGIVYREYERYFGRSYYMIAEIWERDDDGLLRILTAFHELQDSYCSAST